MSLGITVGKFYPFHLGHDCTRESESLRLKMHQWFVDVLKRKGKQAIAVTGSPADRMQQAIDSIDPLLIFPPIDPP